MKQTLYDILGVTPDASFEDIEYAYSARFEALKTETSWESNRFVLLSEAREVLSDANRRVAYDASLAAPARARINAVDIDDEPRSSVKWIIAGVLLLVAIAIWWTMRDDTPPAQPTATPAVPVEPGREQLRPIAEALPTVSAQPEEVATEVAADTASELDAASAEKSDTPALATVAPIVGVWNCFDPVTGRTSQYNFGADGKLTKQQSGNEVQTFAYEVAGRQVKLVDADPPRSMRVEELTARKLILNSAEEGRSVVCSR